MNIVKEISYRLFIVFVMLCLAFVALDMSQPVIARDEQISAKEVIECFTQPFTEILNLKNVKDTDLPGKDYNFTLNILLPIVVYIASIGGFFYLLIEDYKILRSFSRQNRLARIIWTLWLVILILLIFIPAFFGFQLLLKGLALAVLATIIFLIVIGVIYWLSYRTKRV